MLFSYLNLPKIPDDFIKPCYSKLELIDVDPSLEHLNSFRSPMNRGTYIPEYVNLWLLENISTKFHGVDGLKGGFLNRTIYIDGTHQKHVDKGRDYALNYYFDTGGDHTNINWFDDSGKISYTETNIRTGVWALLKVCPEMHEVTGIEPGRSRIFISMSLRTAHLEKFNYSELFGHLLV